jgi:quercetin dioxygenase-like cupin family protein
MKIETIDNAPKVPFNLDGKIMFRSVKNEIVHLSLQPGESIPVHTNPFDVVFYIIEGIATLITDNSSQELCQDNTVFIDQQTNRGLENNSDKMLRLLVFKIF